MYRKMGMAALLLLPLQLIGVYSTAAQTVSAEVIYSGGDILTMDDARPYAEAIAIKAGRIVAVGKRQQIEKAHKGSTTRMVDLGG